MILGIFTGATGLSMFACFLTYYILSFENYTDEYGTSISFNEDYLLLFILGFFLMCLGAYMVYRKAKGLETKALFHGGMVCISSISFVYALFRVIKGFVKGYSTVPFYFAWLFVSLLLFGIGICFFAKKKEN